MARLLCLSGEYFHNVDAKGRLFMPAKLRAQLGDMFYLCKFLKGRLAAFSEDDFSVLAEKIHSMPLAQSETIKQIIFPSAIDCEPDSQGRILIPQNLRDYAGLQKNAAITGMGNHVAVWSQERYETQPKGDEQTLEAAMAELQF